jgi:hypothetical protein
MGNGPVGGRAHAMRSLEGEITDRVESQLWNFFKHTKMVGKKEDLWIKTQKKHENLRGIFASEVRREKKEQ